MHVVPLVQTQKGTAPELGASACYFNMLAHRCPVS